MPNPDAVRQKLLSIADELVSGASSPRTSVRNLLSWFGFQRRGEWTVYAVRQALQEAGLRTIPDVGHVDEVGFDSFVEFKLDPSRNDRQDGEPDRKDDESDLGEDPNLDEELEGLDPSAPWGDYPLDGLLIRSETRTVHGVFRRIEQGFYVMNPDFQRDFIWKPYRQSRLIESVIMRIPLPVFYLAEDEAGRMIVVDGLQRLSTFRAFLKDELRLRLPEQEKLHGRRFSDLSAKLQNRIEDCNLTFYIMDANVPERARLDIFERVNAGEPLSRQQMRNCLYNGNSTVFLREEAHSDLFLQATGGSLRSDTMRDREFVNRFCAFQILGVNRYRGDMDQFLADSLREMNRMQDSEIVTLRRTFRRTLRNNYSIFGKHAFRKQRRGVGRRSVINAALWDVMSTGLAHYDEDYIGSVGDDLEVGFLELLDNEEFQTAITLSTNADKRVRTRFRMVRQMFEEVLD